MLGICEQDQDPLSYKRGSFFIFLIEDIRNKVLQ